MGFDGKVLNVLLSDVAKLFLMFLNRFLSYMKLSQSHIIYTTG